MVLAKNAESNGICKTHVCICALLSCFLPLSWLLLQDQQHVSSKNVETPTRGGGGYMEGVDQTSTLGLVELEEGGGKC